MADSKVNLFSDRLRGMQNKAAQIMEGYTPGGIQVPESVYIGKEQCEIGETSEKGYLKITRQFTISEGEYTGLNAYDGFVLEGNDFGLQSARRWIEQHGCHWPEDDLGKLESIVNRINDIAPTVKFRVKYKQDKNDAETKWCNISVLQLIEGDLDFSDILNGDPAGQDYAAVQEAMAEEEAAEETEETTQDEFDGMNRKQLKEFIASNDLEIRVTTKFTDDDIRAAIRELVVTEEEAAEEAEEVAEEVAEETVDTAELLAFCASQDVEGVDDTMTTEEIVQVMVNYGFDKATLTDDEVNMLVALGLQENIQEPEPVKKTPVKKAAAPAPAKKAPVAPPKKVEAPAPVKKAPVTAPAKKAPAPAPSKVAAPAPAKKVIKR
jgi:hypothetical protein